MQNVEIHKNERQSPSLNLTTKVKANKFPNKAFGNFHELAATSAVDAEIECFEQGDQFFDSFEEKRMTARWHEGSGDSGGGDS